MQRKKRCFRRKAWGGAKRVLLEKEMCWRVVPVAMGPHLFLYCNEIFSFARGKIKMAQRPLGKKTRLVWEE